jgi:hypothetical protein
MERAASAAAAGTGDAMVDDDELAALAMAADPDEPIGPDAVAISFGADSATGLLPAWYMPAATSSVRGPVRRGLVAGLVVALLVINGAGLCVTYGFPEIAW